MALRFTILLLFYILTTTFAGVAKSQYANSGNIVTIDHGKSTTLHATNSAAAAFQWYKDGKPIIQAIYKDYVVNEPGFYTVVGFNQESCPSEVSDPVEVKFSTSNTHDLWITAEDKSKSYGMDNPSFTFKYDGFTDGDDQRILKSSPIATTTASVNSGVGNYTISVAAATSDKYIIHYRSGSLSIKKALLTVTARNDTKYNDGQAYASGNGVDYAGFMNNETEGVLNGSLSYTGSAIGAIEAGSYSLLPMGYTSDNYQINYLPGKLTILNRNVDLAVQIFSENKNVGVGEIYEYTIKANNKGPKASLVQVVDILPGEIDFVRVNSITSGAYSYDKNNHTLTWKIGDFDAYSKAELVLKVRPVKSGTVKNSSSINSAEKDSNSSNNISIDNKEINSLKIPNIFTPNGDGRNDAFVIPSLENFQDNEITVFNRGGNNVFQKKSYQNDWTGSGLSDGTYFYILKIKIDGDKYDIYKGYVTLLRSNINQVNL